MGSVLFRLLVAHCATVGLEPQRSASCSITAAFGVRSRLVRPALLRSSSSRPIRSQPRSDMLEDHQHYPRRSTWHAQRSACMRERFAATSNPARSSSSSARTLGQSTCLTPVAGTSSRCGKGWCSRAKNILVGRNISGQTHRPGIQTRFTAQAPNMSIAGKPRRWLPDAADRAVSDWALSRKLREGLRDRNQGR